MFEMISVHQFLDFRLTPGAKYLCPCQHMMSWGCVLALAVLLGMPETLSNAQNLKSKSTSSNAGSNPEQDGTRPGKYYAPQPLIESIDLGMYERIRNEGLTHGKAMDFAVTLNDGIGPRLTGSPNMRKANDWTRDTLTEIGLQNAHLEDWGEFGMGWYQINTWGRILTPEPEPLWMQAAPWSAATNGAVSGQIVYMPLTDSAHLDSFRGTLKGKVVLLSAMRPIPDLNQQFSYRYTDQELAELEGSGAPPRSVGPPAQPPDDPQTLLERQRKIALRQRALKMMQDEGVAAILLESRPEGRNLNTGLILDDNGSQLSREAYLRQSAFTIPYAVMMTEHYNRLVRLAQARVPVSVELNIQTTFTGDHEHGFNTVAEIAGNDPQLKDQVVMVGGHLDSWVSGTGATDDGAGVVVAMEAVRILKDLGLKPKRTIRIALWSGEEEGEFGSMGYVEQHFGKFASSAASNRSASSGALTTKKEWETLDAYYNLDEGGGKVRGIYSQGNYAIASIFAQWIAPLKDLGVTAVANRVDNGSDQEAFDNVGLPGFEFIQDELDYETRTHHSNLDTVDHLNASDLEESAIVEAIFLWNSSEREAMLPRSPYPHPENDEKLSVPISGPIPSPAARPN